MTRDWPGETWRARARGRGGRPGDSRWLARAWGLRFWLGLYSSGPRGAGGFDPNAAAAGMNGEAVIGSK